MPDIVTPDAARRLQRAVERYRRSVPAPVAGNWAQMTDAALWAAVLGQIAVVGGANSGDLLRAELSNDLETWYALLCATSSDARATAIHKRLRSAGVRYVAEDIQDCKKSKSAAYDFNLLQAYGGPAKYFSMLAGVPVEAWRVGIVSDEMLYIRNKGARDLLIGLGLAVNAIALDSRLQAVLTTVGVSLPSDLATNRVKYKLLERELLEKVCQPCSITGAHLDRILFSKWKEVA